MADDRFDDFEEEPTEDEQEERHRFLILLFQFVKSEAQDRVNQFTEALADRTVSVKEWADLFREEMVGRHAEAYSIGRRLAGDMAPQSEADLAAGKAAWARQSKFFDKFVQDVEGGRYDADGAFMERMFSARANQYPQAVRGTAHEAFREAMGDEKLRWKLGPTDHCQPDPEFPYYCVGLSEEDPKPASEWPTSPALGDTPCRNYCSCGFESLDGKYSTDGI